MNTKYVTIFTTTMSLYSYLQGILVKNLLLGCVISENKPRYSDLITQINGKRDTYINPRITIPTILYIYKIKRNPHNAYNIKYLLRFFSKYTDKLGFKELNDMNKKYLQLDLLEKGVKDPLIIFPFRKKIETVHEIE